MSPQSIIKLTKSLVLLMFFSIVTCFAKKPKLTIIMVTDQFAYHYIGKLEKHFKYGYKFLLENGINYQEAHHPHGIPETAPGHNSLSTAVVPHDHGVVCNSWYNHKGTEIVYPESPDPSNPSPALTMVDGLSDTFTLASSEHQKHIAYSISLKDRAAIGTANRFGKPIWLNLKTGNFVSSQTYFKELPTWLHDFNKKADLASKKTISWIPLYDEKSDAYNFPFIRNYDYASYDFRLCPNKKIPIDHSKKDPFEVFAKTPEADKLLFSLAHTVLENECKPDDTNRMILWLCLSSLDLLAHYYGPDSFEVTDFLYQQDKNMGEFIKDILQRYGSENVLFTFTADHGIQPIPEISFKKGITSARRIMSQPLQEKMNAMIQKKYGITNLINQFESSSYFFNHDLLTTTDIDTKKEIEKDLIHFLKSVEGIKNVWTPHDLKKATFQPYELEQFYKNQLYHDRSGDLIVMPQPYCLITNYPKGCNHNTPYDYDTHVPLILYQAGLYEKKKIQQKVWMPQLAVTLAKMLGVPHPSASTFDLLPGIFDTDKSK